MFLGMNGFKWFEGVVEDRFDPLELGRVRVRVYGLHSEQKVKSEKVGIPTEELLWMNCITPITSARVSGIGDSPTGLVEGSEVFGYFRDQMCQVGVILGSIGGIEHKTNPDKGFSDPNGQYPREEYFGQQDVNKLARNMSLNDQGEPTTDGDVGANSTYNRLQEVQTSVAVNPDDGPVDDYVADDDPNYTIEKMLVNDEGVRNRVYWDSEGYPTIGIGHLIIMRKTKDMSEINRILSEHVGRQTNGSITSAEISQLFKQDLEKVQKDIVKNSRTGPVYIKMNRSRQMAMENMSFQMGVAGLAQFKNTLKAMEEERWKDAYRGLQDSLWARQTPGRSQRVSKVVLTGNLESYGVMVPPPENRTLSAMAVSRAENNSPEDPFTPEDSRIMFEEPKTSYAAQYPYNHVYESESGHVQEFDDTPGAERYRRIHPSNTYTETRPDGSVVTKIVGDNYLIVQSGNKVNIKGNLQVVVEGNAQVYHMGNVVQQVDGNVQELVRGNVKQKVEGEVRGEYMQNVEVIVHKDLNANVKQNLNAEVEQNATVNVTETATVTAKNARVAIDEKLEATAKNMDFNADNINMFGKSLVKITGGTVQVG